ncbi:MAG: hypothetical protein M1828_000692 [Chrysothrix sp. TS-e1954]|nr:MAG: hypothetical protein M1828_000692 [Chrysothrix sp. TS-e1954]
MSYSSSKRWSSGMAQEEQKFTYICAQMRRKYSSSALVPWNLNDWLAHREAMKIADVEMQNKKLEARQRRQAPINPCCGGIDKMPKGNRSAVLAQETIWCVDWQVPERWGGTRWPCPKEMLYEGTQRQASKQNNYGRELPLVRDWKEGNDTVTYERVARLPEYDLDAVRRIPDYEDLYFPVDEIPEEVGADLLAADLRAALDLKPEVGDPKEEIK